MPVAESWRIWVNTFNKSINTWWYTTTKYTTNNQPWHLYMVYMMVYHHKINHKQSTVASIYGVHDGIPPQNILRTINRGIYIWYTWWYTTTKYTTNNQPWHLYMVYMMVYHHKINHEQSTVASIYGIHDGIPQQNRPQTINRGIYIWYTWWYTTTK